MFGKKKYTVFLGTLQRVSIQSFCQSYRMGTTGMGLKIRGGWGGRYDTIAFLSLSAAAFLLNPSLNEELEASTIRLPLHFFELNLSLYPLVVGGIFLWCLIAGAWVGIRWRQLNNQVPRAFESECTVPSDSPPPVIVPHGEVKDDAFLLGYTLDTATPIWLPYEEAVRHVFIRGMTGVGKTVLSSFLMFQHIAKGGGVLFIDGKIDADNIRMLHQMACWSGREGDLEIINPGNPEFSNTYNPILFGDPDEVAARIMGLIPSTESNAGADHYKQSGNQGLTVLISALQEAKIAYNFLDLSILLISPKALMYLADLLDPKSPAARLYDLFLDQYRVGRGKEATIDMKRLRDMFGGLAGRLFSFGSGQFGQVLNSYSPEVNLYQSIRQRKITYIALPTMGKDIAASNFGKLAIGDLRTATAWLQSLDVRDRPNPPHLCVFDEAGSYATQTWDRMFEQARSAGLVLMPAVQTNANFEAVSRQLAEMIEGNTQTKIFFRLGSQLTAQAAADYIGTKMTILRSLSITGSKSENDSLVTAAPTVGQTEGSGINYTEREQESYRVSPDDLKALGKGEAVVLYGNRVYPIKVPLLKFSNEFRKKAGEPRVNHRAPSTRPADPYVRSLNLFGRMNEFLSTAEDRKILSGG